MEEKSERYKNGFNHGYLLQEAGITLPKLESNQETEKSWEDSPYRFGLRDGTAEFSRERTSSREAELRQARESRSDDRQLGRDTER